MSWSAFAIENAEIKGGCLEKVSLKYSKENQYNKLNQFYSRIATAQVLYFQWRKDSKESA